MATYNIDKITSPSGDVYKLQDKVSGFTTNTGTVTSVTAGTGLKIGTATSGGSITTTGTINHINSVTAGTVGTSSVTSGKTLAVPYITYDAQGHITATGTHTHTVSGFATLTNEGDLEIGTSSDTVQHSASVKNTNGEVRLLVSANGNHGVYSGFSGTGAGWIIYRSTDSSDTTAYIPRPLNVSGTLTADNITVSGSIAISATGKGFNLTDSSGTTYGGLYENGNNLWIGAASSDSPHHRGSTGNVFISSGYNNTNSTGNSTIYIWVPTLSGSTWGGTSYGVLHSGNYNSYALPLSGGTLTGNLVVGQTSDTVARNVTVRNSLGSVALAVGTDGAHGLYSNTKGGWLLYADKNANSTNPNLYISRPLVVGNASASYCEVNSGGTIRIRNTTGDAWVQAENGNGVNAIWMNAKTDGTVVIASRTTNGTTLALLTRANNSTTVTASGAWNFTGNITFSSTSDLGIIQGYNSTTKYNILRNHGNGNVSLSACSAGLYLGYEQTTFVNFLNGKMSLNSSGYLTMARTIANVTSGEAEVAASNDTHRIYLYCNSNGTSGIYAFKADGTGYSVISTANGAITSTFNGHATSDLALSGGTITGSVILNNNIYLYSKDTGGTSRVLAGIGGDNNTFFGFGSKVGSVGATYFDGNIVYIRSNGAVNVEGGVLILSTTSSSVERVITVATGNVSGSLRANNGGTGGAFGLYATKTGNTARNKWIAYMDSSGTIHHETGSDARDKNVLGDISEQETLSVLRDVRIVNYTYKNDAYETIQNGVVAQQIRDVLIANKIGYRSYLSIHDLSGDEMYYDLTVPEDKVSYAIDYSKFTPILWKGWQLHDEDITTLKEENEELKKRIMKLETTLSKISVS